MSLFQILLLCVAGLIIISSIDFKVIKVNLPKPNINHDTSKDTNAVTTPVVEPEHQQDSLLLIVNKWQCLKDACENNNLSAASAKLDEIFPMLIEVKK